MSIFRSPLRGDKTDFFHFSDKTRIFTKEQKTNKELDKLYVTLVCFWQSPVSRKCCQNHNCFSPPMKETNKPDLVKGIGWATVPTLHFCSCFTHKDFVTAGQRLKQYNHCKVLTLTKD